MLTIREEAAFVVVTASGTLTRGNYDRFVPEFERVARERGGPVPMLIDATRLDGWDAGGLWQEVSFDIAHRTAFGTMAVVGEERWQEWGTKLSKPFFRAEMRFFRPDEMEAAHRWLERAAGRP